MKIESTSDYEKFKVLEGNRTIDRKKVKKLKISILENGYIINPILVNEKYEIIDGQHRFTACKELGKPIYYIVVDGLTVKDCIHLNLNQDNWHLADYVNYYMSMGNDNYMRLHLLHDRFPEFNYSMLYAFVKDTSAGGYTISMIKNGGAVISQEEYSNTFELLEWIRGYEGVISKLTGRKESVYRGFAYAYGNPTVDRKRFKDQFMKANPKDFQSGKVMTVLDSISDIYNYRTRNEDKIDLASDYQKEARGCYEWHGKNLIRKEANKGHENKGDDDSQEP